MRKRTHSREAALQALYQLDLVTTNISEALDSVWQAEAAAEESTAETEVKMYAEKLVRGVADKQVEIGQIIENFAEHWKMDRMACVDRNILRLATFEIVYSDEIPPKVAINEAVELAKKFGDGESPKFVNGILDKIAKEHAKERES